MDRTTVFRVIAVGFFFYALYTASFLTGMLAVPTSPILLIGTVAKTLLAVACGVGIWTRRHWAPAIVVLTGIVIAVMWLLYGFVLGIVAYLYGVAMALVAILVTMLVAAYVRMTTSAKATVVRRSS